MAKIAFLTVINLIIHRRVKLPGVHPTRSQAPRCATHHGVKLRSVHHTAESSDQNFFKNSAVCITLQRQAPQCASKSLSLVAFKGTMRRNPFGGENIYHERKYLKYKKWVY